MPIPKGAFNIAQLRDRSGFGLTGEVEVPIIPGIPDATIDIGFLRIDTTIDRSGFIGLELVNGIKYSRSVTKMPLNAASIISKDPQTKRNFVKLGNTITGSGEQFSAIGTSNFRIGSSSTNQIVTFSKVVVELPATFVKAKIADTVNQLKSQSAVGGPKEPLAKVTSADFQILSATDISLQVISEVKNPIPGLTLDMGSLHMGVLLDDDTLVGLDISPITLGQGISMVDLKVLMKLSDGSNNMDQKVALLADAVLNKRTDSKLLAGVADIKITPSGGNPGAVIDQMSEMKVNVVVGDVIGAMPEPGSSSGTLPLDISVLLPPADLDIQKLLKISRVQISALKDQVLSLSSNFGYTNPVPVSVSIPYLSMDTIVDNTRLVSTAITGVKLVPSQGEMLPRVNLGFNNDPALPDKIQSLYTQLMDKKLSSKLEVGALSFGNGNSKSQLLRFIKVDVTQYAIKALNSAPKLPTLDSGAMDLVKVQIDKNLEFNAEFRKSKEIYIQTAVPLNSSISIELNIPFFKVASYLDNTNAFDIALNDFNVKLVEGQSQVLGVKCLVAVHDTEDLSNAIAKLVNAVLRNEQITQNAGVGSVRIGVSEQDHITAFSKLQVLQDIEPIAGQKLRDLVHAPGTAQVPELGSISEMVKLDQVSVQAMAQKVLSINVGAKVQNPMKISVRGMNYFTSSVGVNGKEVVLIQTSGVPVLTVLPGSNNISLALNMKFSSSQESKNMVNLLVKESKENLGQQKSLLTATGLAFGVDQESSFQFLSKSILGINSYKIINNEAVEKAKTMIFSNQLPSSSLPTPVLKLNGVAVEFTDKKSIETKIRGGLELPLKINLDIPFLKFGTNLNNQRFFDLGVYGARIGGGTNNLDLTTRLEFHDTPDLASAIEDLVAEFAKSDRSANLLGSLGGDFLVSKDGSFISNQLPPPRRPVMMRRSISDIQGTIGGGYFSFGLDDSEANRIDIFDDISIELSTQSVLKLALEKLPASNQTATQLPLDKFNLSLKNIKGGTAPKRIVKTSFTAEFTNDFGIELSLKGFGFLSAVSGISGDSGAAAVAAFSMGGLSINPGNNKLDLNAQLFFPSSPNVIDIVGNFAQNLMNNLGHTTETLFATGFRFGYSAENCFEFLSKAKFGIESSKLLNKEMLEKYTSQNVSVPAIGAVQLSDVKISATNAGAISVDTVATLKNQSVQAEASIGFLMATTLIDRHQ